MIWSTTNGYTLRYTTYCCLFFVFLLPLSVEGVSINYTFALMPLSLILINRSVKRVTNGILLAIILFTLIFCIATIYQLDYSEHTIRRLSSFTIFMTMFSFSFVEIDTLMIKAFATAVVGISVVFSIASILLFFYFGGSSLDFEAKDLVGGNRYGFIYLIGIYMVSDRDAKTLSQVIAKYALLISLLAGILLTFSRGTIVALLVGWALFVLFGSAGWFIRPNAKGILKIIIYTGGVAVALLMLSDLFPIAFQFFSVRLNVDSLMDEASNVEGSGGIRIALARQIAEFVIANPFTGSGFLGVWILPDTVDGLHSAHNQYLDVLFRTGLIGFITYICLLYCLLRYLYRAQRALFWGLVSIIIFGFFNETFKESQGAFILAFWIGMLSQSLRTSQLRTSTLGPTAPRS